MARCGAASWLARRTDAALGPSRRSRVIKMLRFVCLARSQTCIMGFSQALNLRKPMLQIGKLASLLAITVTPQKDINVRPPVGGPCFFFIYLFFWGGSCSLFGSSSLRFRWVGEHRVLCVVPAITIQTEPLERGREGKTPSVGSVPAKEHQAKTHAMRRSAKREPYM